MKKFVFLFAIILSMTIPSMGQTYLEHLQKKTPGLGTVTVTQSKAIDELINGKNVPQDENTKVATPSHQDNHTQPAHQDNHTKTSPTTTPQNNISDSQKKLAPDSAKKTERQESIPNKTENETPVVDMRKKVMRQSYKVIGYRVQAFAGGNSRNDRLKAEQTGNAIKMKFPEQPVYVHFYSPRWICRVGNFRSLAEAQKMLAKIRALGYKQACLVKGKITVQN